MFYLSQFPWCLYGTHCCSICFSYSNCLVKSLVPPLPPTPVRSHSKLQRCLTLFILPLGEAELKANWRFYLVETCYIHRKLAHKSWMFPEWSKAYVSNVVRLLFGHDVFFKVWGLLVKVVFERRRWRKAACCVGYNMLGYNSAVPENSELQLIYKNQRHGNLARFLTAPY